MMKFVLPLLASLSAVTARNSLAMTPPMGWMSWEIFRCDIGALCILRWGRCCLLCPILLMPNCVVAVLYPFPAIRSMRILVVCVLLRSGARPASHEVNKTSNTSTTHFLSL